MRDTVVTIGQISGTAIASAQILENPEVNNIIIQVVILVATWLIGVVKKKKKEVKNAGD